MARLLKQGESFLAALARNGRGFLWVGGVLVTLSRPAAASTAPCPAYAEGISLDFQTLAPRPNYDNTLNTTGIRNLFDQNRVAISDRHAKALGVTFATPVFSLEARTRMMTEAGGYCVYLQSVFATFGLRDITVHVANEYPPGTCEYRTILDHENQHVAINRDVLGTAAPEVRLSLEHLLGEERPEFTRDPEHVTRQILDALTENMRPAIDGFEAELERRNAAIDTASNYDATAALCRDWNRGTVWPQQPTQDDPARSAPVRAYAPTGEDGNH